MSRSTQRLALPRVLVAPLLLALLTPGLVACGDDTGDDASSAGGLDTVTVEGDVGSAPKVTFDGQVEVSEIETDTLITGDGEKVEEGDQVLTHLWIGNGYTQEEALNTYTDEKPELITISDDIGEVFQAAIKGQRIGSRVLVAAPAADAFGEGGNPALGIGNEDTVIMVVDLASGVLDDHEASSKSNAEWDFFVQLRDAGRRTARSWLAAHYGAIGVRGTLDLESALP